MSANLLTSPKGRTSAPYRVAFIAVLTEIERDQPWLAEVSRSTLVSCGGQGLSPIHLVLSGRVY
jgi:hypothetical protein